MMWTTRPRCDLGGLAAIVTGQGPKVLLIHGVGLRADAWAPQIDALAAQYQVVAVDLPGHGQSPLFSNTPSLADYTNRIASVLTAPTIVIGHSMGAMIALDMATRHPARVRAVAALNAIFERPAAAVQAVQTRAAQLDGASLPDPEPTLTRWFDSEETPERTACRQWLQGMNPRGYQQAYRCFAQSNGPRRADLAAMDCPALFLTGAKEPNSTPDMSRTMARLTRHGRARVIDGAAHMMPMTHPRAVNKALFDLIAELTT